MLTTRTSTLIHLLGGLNACKNRILLEKGTEVRTAHTTKTVWFLSSTWLLQASRVSWEQCVAARRPCQVYTGAPTAYDRLSGSSPRLGHDAHWQRRQGLLAGC